MRQSDYRLSVAQIPPTPTAPAPAPSGAHHQRGTTECISRP